MKINFGKILLGLSFILGATCLWAAEAKSWEWLNYSTKGHPKANGLDLAVRYPSYFTAREGRRPHVVQVFENQKSREAFFYSLMIVIQKLPDGITFNIGDLSEVEIEEFYNEMISSFGPNAQPLEKKRIVHETQKGVIISSLNIVERAGNIGYSIGRHMTFSYKNNIINVSCQVYSNNYDKYELTNEYNRHSAG